MLRRADGEHRPLQMEHASWYMAIVCSSALYELLGGEIYLAVSRCTFVHFILHIHLISHFCVPRLKFLEPKWSHFLHFSSYCISQYLIVIQILELTFLLSEIPLLFFLFLLKNGKFHKYGYNIRQYLHLTMPLHQ